MKWLILLQLRDILEDTGGVYCDILMRGNYRKHQLQSEAFGKFLSWEQIKCYNKRPMQTEPVLPLVQPQ